ncbi:MAG: TRAP transporter small permease subunit [gamma proteobacterium symbiont of Clathrolucina costata]|uniref:TRAP transporter small permease protein n=1 Tax=Candidatus Thiodiazotropha taylori TaxID=2792791 RepID=A0A9E4TTQ9_9GAMM|nr:TRAP transporter small permease subunit [Candidatus Thiodiazotropha taylori]MCW4237073.1 TRAP transporter small permease subunit [Candidatus Thiodiazotropha endolucinida]
MSVASPASEYHIPIVAWLNGIVRRIAETTAWLNVALILVIVVQVVMRYGFNKGMVPLEELMWHLYAVAFMFGMAYAVTNDSHIRVDVVHMALPKRVQHLFEIIGILLLLMPVLWILFDHSLGWAIEAYRVNESSQNPTGLPYRWIIKSVVPATMVLIFMAALARLIQEVSLLFHYGKEPDDQFPGRVSMMRRLFKPQQRKDDRNDGGVR